MSERQIIYCLLAGMAGMVLAVPTIFLGDVAVVGGLLGGGVALGITLRNRKDAS